MKNIENSAAVVIALEKCEPELRVHAIQLFKDLNSDKLDEDERFSTAALLNDILFPSNYRLKSPEVCFKHEQWPFFLKYWIQKNQSWMPDQENLHVNFFHWSNYWDCFLLGMQAERQSKVLTTFYYKWRYLPGGTAGQGEIDCQNRQIFEKLLANWNDSHWQYEERKNEISQ